MAVLWISHRGYKINADENTISAFLEAYKIGYRSIETDLRMTMDGHIVLCHDPNLQRIAGHHGHVARMTRRELEPILLNKGHKLAFFDQLIHINGDCRWTFDIKKENGLEVIAALKKYSKDPTFRPIIRSARYLLWSPHHEKALQEAIPDLPCYARKTECWRAGLAAIAKLGFFAPVVANRVYSLKPEALGFYLFNPYFAEFFHKRGARVLAFLPRSRAEHVDALNSGFDEILSDGQIL